MATEKQIAANRRNSRLSTGPRTEAGKSHTRMNAIKSGIHAQSHIIRGEDPDALARLAAEYNAEFHPVTPRQRDLVDNLVHNEWHIRRLRAIEADLWALKFEGIDSIPFDPNNGSQVRSRRHPLATAFHEDFEKRLEKLQRSIHAYERSTTRALRQLDELRNSEPAPDESATCGEIGFVPSTPEQTVPAEPAAAFPAPLPEFPPQPRAANGATAPPKDSPAVPKDSRPHPAPSADN